MKKNAILQMIFTCIFAGLMLASCTKEYYLDGGVHDPKYDGTILSFLKSRPELFDSLVKVIDLAGYTELLDNPQSNITFYAAANQSITSTMRVLNRQLYSRGQDTVSNMNQVSADVWKKYVSRYIYNERYLLKDYPQLDTLDLLTYPGQGYLCISGESTNIGTFYNDVKSTNSAGVQQIIKYAGYRQVIINYTSPVATSDIQPTNGVVHVLNFSKHAFSFLPYDFAIDAINEGITY